MRMQKTFEALSLQTYGIIHNKDQYSPLHAGIHKERGKVREEWKRGVKK